MQVGEECARAALLFGSQHTTCAHARPRSRGWWWWWVQMKGVEHVGPLTSSLNLNHRQKHNQTSKLLLISRKYSHNFATAVQTNYLEINLKHSHFYLALRLKLTSLKGSNIIKKK